MSALLKLRLALIRWLAPTPSDQVLDAIAHCQIRTANKIADEIYQGVDPKTCFPITRDGLCELMVLAQDQFWILISQSRLIVQSPGSYHVDIDRDPGLTATE